MDKSKLNAIKKNFRAKAAERKLEVTIARDNLSITFKHSAGRSFQKVKINATSFQNALSLNYENYFPKFELYHFVIEHYWIPFAKEAGYDALTVFGYSSEFRTSLAALAFRPLNDSPLTTSWGKLVNKSLTANEVVLLLNEERFKKTVDYITGLRNFFEAFKTKHPTFTFYVRVAYSYIGFDFYYEGVTGSVHSTISNGKFEFEIDENAYSADSVEEMETALRSYFQKIDISMRIKHVFNYPRHHFERYINDNCPVAVKLSSSEILETLRFKTNPKAVEDYFATCTKEPVKIGYKVRENKIIFLTSLMNHFFLFDANNQMHAFDEKELHHAEAKMKALIEEQHKLDLQKVTEKIAEKFGQ